MTDQAFLDCLDGIIIFLDSSSLCNAQLVCKSWSGAILNTKHYWKCVLQSLKGGKTQDWDKIIAFPWTLLELRQLAQLVIQEKLNKSSKLRPDASLPMIAANYGHCEIFETLQNRGFKIKDFKVPLELAAKKGHLEVVKFITQNNASVPLPISIAATQDNVSMMEYLLKRFKKKEWRDTQGNTIRHIALEHGALGVFEYLQDKSSCKSPINNHGTSLCHLLAQFGYLNLIKKHIPMRKSKLLPRDKEGNTPMHTAAIHNHTEIVKFFCITIMRNPMNYKGLTPLHLAAERGNLSVVQVIMEHIDADPHPKAVSYLLKYFDVLLSHRDEGMTPLHLAVQRNHLEVVKFIMENVQDKHPLDSYGLTPLEYAVHSFEVVQYILENYKVSTTIVDKMLFKAIKEDNIPLFDTIWRVVGPRNVHFKDAMGTSILHLAARQGLCRIFQDLFHNCHEKNPKDCIWRTPLHWAIYGGHYPIIKLIIEELGYQDGQDKLGLTPLQLAQNQTSLSNYIASIMS